MHKSRLGALGIDCQVEDLTAHLRFWSEALGYAMPANAVTEDGKYGLLEGPEGEVKIFLQRVDHPPRVHLDIETDDVAAEVARLEKLGAKRVADYPRWVVLEAPSGHRFCVVRAQRADFQGEAREWG